jgi:hypothetical protein
MCSTSLSEDEMFFWNDFSIPSSENFVLPCGLYLDSVTRSPVAAQRLRNNVPAAMYMQAKIG